MFLPNYPTIFFTLVTLLFGVCILQSGVHGGPVAVTRDQGDIQLGSCVWVGDRQCPDKDIKFYLFTNNNKNDRQFIYIQDTWDKSNLSSSNFDPDLPTKIIMHGFNSDMYLTSLIEMKDEYFLRDEFNIFYVDYSDLARGPCYVQAVHNIRHVGKCVGQLIDRILETGTRNIHLIGFSLGAQLANFASIAVRPYTIKRITGLDPALPLFMGVPKDDKLDPSDAKFVDVYHTNSFVQGKVERCGHVDFYFNGGIIQPGCATWKDNPVGCSHNRAPLYFMESISSKVGFYGWPCGSYISYLLRMCPLDINKLFVAGEDVRTTTRGMHFINTRSESPYAQGRYRQSANMFRQQSDYAWMPTKRRDPLLEEIDQWGKLDGAFNNIDQFPTPLPQDPMDDWEYFGQMGPSQITQQNNYYYSPIVGGGDHDNVEDSIPQDTPEAPYGVQVLDVLHRKQSSSSHRRPPLHRIRTKTKTSSNSTSEPPHLIQKLWEDYQSVEKRQVEVPSVPYWRRRQSYDDGSQYGNDFDSLPILIPPPLSSDAKGDSEGRIVKIKLT